MQGLMEKATNSGVQFPPSVDVTDVCIELNDCFSLCFSLLHEIEAQYHTDMIQRLATGLCSTPNFARTKLQLLCMLFNLLENLSPIRATVFIQMLRLAIASNTSKLLINEFPRVLNWISQWNLSVESQAEVYLLISQAYAQINASTNSQVFLLKYLRTFDDADEKRLAQATENASKAIIATLADNAVNQCDPLLDLAAVKHLNRSGAPQQEKDTFALLQIFATQGCAEYSSFVADSKTTAVSALGLDEREALLKIRRLTLISLASGKEQVPYSEIATALQLSSDDDVEETVIDAVSYNCMDAKLDQDNLVVVIRRVDQRFFSGDQASWDSLADQLDRWATNIDEILTNLPNTNPITVDDLEN